MLCGFLMLSSKLRERQTFPVSQFSLRYRIVPGVAMSNVTRRELVVSAGLAAPAFFAPRLASAASADFPARNIQFIIPYAPGGGFDVYVRVIAPVMEKYLP